MKKSPKQLTSEEEKEINGKLCQLVDIIFDFWLEKRQKEK